jgi:hypothetical protein
MVAVHDRAARLGQAAHWAEWILWCVHKDTSKRKTGEPLAAGPLESNYKHCCQKKGRSWVHLMRDVSVLHAETAGQTSDFTAEELGLALDWLGQAKPLAGAPNGSGVLNARGNGNNVGHGYSSGDLVRSVIEYVALMMISMI